MDSPLIIPVFQQIRLQTGTDRALYLQLADSILAAIRNGQLPAGQKLPGTREAAALLQLNRVTVTKAYEELQLQGWLESFTGSGTYVSEHIPEAHPKNLRSKTKVARDTAGFTITNRDYLRGMPVMVTTPLHLDDGYPDPKLAPLAELYRAYRNQLSRGSLYQRFGSYGQADGPLPYRKALSEYLNETRGLTTTPDNIMSVKGTIMGLNLVCNGLINAGDIIVSGTPGWNRAIQNFLHAGAKHLTIPVDEQGIVTDALRKICRKNKVRMVYVTPHHHYPTTVPLRIDRRLELLQLAAEHGFIIFEDDYDFDFHYRHRPLLPLAGADENGMVIYCGSFSKCFSPAFRMGYLAASKNVIDHLSKVRLIIDRQGDHILDNAMAELLQEGTIQRYLRKAWTVYKDRRDHFCNLLQTTLSGSVNFAVPEGGMSVWASFDPALPLEKLAAKALQKGLSFYDGSNYRLHDPQLNATRLGFASSDEEAQGRSVDIIKHIIKKM